MSGTNVWNECWLLVELQSYKHCYSVVILTWLDLMRQALCIQTYAYVVKIANRLERCANLARIYNS